MSTPVSEATLRLLNAQDWADVLLRVEATVIRLLKSDLDSDGLPQGIQPRDIAYEAITSLYTGERQWDAIAQPNIAKFLVHSIIRSKVSHMFASPRATMILRLEPYPEQEDYGESEYAAQTIATATEPSCELEAILHTKDLIARFEAALQDDKLAKEVFRLRLEGCLDKTVAFFLGIHINEVRAANRRIAKVGNRVLPGKIRTP